MIFDRPLFGHLRPGVQQAPAQAPTPRLLTWHMAPDRADFGPRGAG